MTQANQFWQYAEEAMLGARHSKNETEKRALLELARSWTQAALQSESILVAHDNPTESRATKAA